jgi:hypothetical protein
MFIYSLFMGANFAPYLPGFGADFAPYLPGFGANFAPHFLGMGGFQLGFNILSTEFSTMGF